MINNYDSDNLYVLSVDQIEHGWGSPFCIDKATSTNIQQRNTHTKTTRVFATQVPTVSQK